jgi:hypothetical protein
LEVARNLVNALLDEDPDLATEEHRMLKSFLSRGRERVTWGKIS